MANRTIKCDTTDDVRTKVLDSIKQKISSWEISQGKAAERLGTARSRVNRMLLDRVDKISLEALLYYAEAADLGVEINIVDKSAQRDVAMPAAR
jgi:predicted XRE-type DNA-binding protein